MIDQIKDLVFQLTQKEIEGNSQIQNNVAGSVAQETGNSILQGIQSAVSEGNFSDILGLAKNMDIQSLATQPMVQKMIENLSSNLSQKVGIDGATSASIASGMIPQILSKVLGSSNNGFNISDLLSSLTGDNNPLDQNKDGKIGLDDAITAVKNGNIGDILGNIFKK